MQALEPIADEHEHVVHTTVLISVNTRSQKPHHFREASTHPEVRRRLTQLHAEVLRRVRRAIDAALEGTPVRPPSQPQRDAAAAAFTSALLHDLHLHQITDHAIDLSGIAALIARGLQASTLAVTG